MTMTDDPHEGYIFHPVARWLEANGIDWGQHPSCFSISIDHDRREIVMDDLMRDEHGRTAVEQAAASMIIMEEPRRYPLKVEPPDGLLTSYREACERSRRRVDLETLGRAGATVVTTTDASRLLFLSSAIAEQEGTVELINEVVSQLFPGVQIGIWFGVDTVVHGRKAGDGE